MEASTALNMRRLSVSSCTECRTRKIQCDRKQPCSQCARADRPTRCIYQSPYSVNGLPRRIAKVRFRQVKFPSHVTDNTPKEGPSGDHQIRLKALEDRVQQLEHDSARPDGSSKSINYDGLPATAAQRSSWEPQSQPFNEFLQGKNDKTRLYSRSHWVVLLLELEDVRTYLTGPRKSELRDVHYMSLKRDDPGQISPANRSFDLLEQLSLSPQVANDLVAAYLSNFETVYRIIHIPTFLKHYGTFWELPRESYPVFRATLLVVLAIGWTVTGGVDEQSSLNSQVGSWISAAEKWASSLPQKDTLRLEYVQLLCLLLLYRRVHASDASFHWLNSSSLVRTAMMMGLHRDPSSFARMTPFHAEIRRRLWYTIVELDLQSSISAGMPPTVTLAHSDCRYPLNVHDDELLDQKASGEHLVSHDLDFCTRTAFQIAMLQTLPPRWQIANIAAMKNDGLEYSGFLSLREKLVGWLKHMPWYCRGQASTLPLDLAQTCKMASAILHLTVHSALITLHGSNFAHLPTAPSSPYGPAVQSALDILAHFDQPECTSPRSSLEMVSGEMVRDLVLHASFILCIELLAELNGSTDDSPVPGSNGNMFPLSPKTQNTIRSLKSAENYLVYHLSRGLRVSKYLIFLRMAIASVQARLHLEPPLDAVKAAFHTTVHDCKIYLSSPGTTIENSSPGDMEPSIPTDRIAPDNSSLRLISNHQLTGDTSPMTTVGAVTNIWSSPAPSLFDLLMAEFDAGITAREGLYF
ncbi:hypothetical protein ASPFODRAFT_221052 [Aspergillus luchuensis CBS 106.47]|uniref:Zn(2)-C6 fungal-type domain-containing protein n=1 Tax=Aspergillus luchuensis (strain CBS 106.47) TaxID=1137211 RepID=A0A1M3T8F9_ASPLC|nr:hypothetical protein ASPFODRAFT_221052 [Aspergillus luchuensis CBS 106.47]